MDRKVTEAAVEAAATRGGNKYAWAAFESFLCLLLVIPSQHGAAAAAFALCELGAQDGCLAVATKA